MMKQVIYMAGAPIQHPGEKGREILMKYCDLFTSLEAEHLFLSAGKVEGFVNNNYCIQSFNEAYDELRAMATEHCKPRASHNESERYMVER